MNELKEQCKYNGTIYGLMKVENKYDQGTY